MTPEELDELAASFSICSYETNCSCWSAGEALVAEVRSLREQLEKQWTGFDDCHTALVKTQDERDSLRQQLALPEPDPCGWHEGWRADGDISPSWGIGAPAAVGCRSCGQWQVQP